MKMSKDLRDAYIKEHHKNKTNKQLAIDTGWSETTIKSIKNRLGVVNSARAREIEEYILKHNISTVDEVNSAAVFLGCPPEKVRDIMKSLGIFSTQGDKAFEALKRKYEGLFTFGEYRNTKAYIDTTCSACGKVHKKRPNDLVTYNFKCTCVRDSLRQEARIIKLEEQKLSKARVLAERLEAEFLNLTKVYPLVRAIIPGSKVEVMCSSCECTRIINRNTLTRKNPQVCPDCAIDKSRDKAAEYWKDLLYSNGIELISGEIINGRSKVVVRRPCGHKASLVLAGLKLYNCQACIVGDEHFLYILNIEGYGYKVGRSINVENRVKEFKKYIEGNITVVQAVQGTYLWAKTSEEFLLNKYSEYRVFNTAVFPGATEILGLEDVNELLEDIKELSSVVS